MASELTIEADYGLLDEARELIHWTGRELGFDEAAIWDIKVAATEALANAIEHGAAGDGLIHMRLTPGEGALSIEISGGGKPEPQATTASSRRGRGFTIMSALMDEVVFSRHGDDTVIQLEKRLRPVPADTTV